MEIHPKKYFEVRRYAFSLLSGQTWELLQISHKSIVPEFESEAKFLVEFTREPVGLVQALQQNVKVL